MKKINWIRGWIWLGAVVLIGAATGAGVWTRLAEDEIHDPENRALSSLQEPQEALSVLHPDTAGNMVNWVEALQQGQINPRHALNDPDHVPEELDSKVLLKDTSYMPMVLFPHKPHTQWLSCDNCHEKIFRSEIGATDISMFQILQGESCGQCHGAVAFPLTECNRCHSVPHDSPQARRLLQQQAEKQAATQ